MIDSSALPSKVVLPLASPVRVIFLAVANFVAFPAGVVPFSSFVVLGSREFTRQAIYVCLRLTTTAA